QDQISIAGHLTRVNYLTRRTGMDGGILRGSYINAVMGASVSRPETGTNFPVHRPDEKPMNHLTIALTGFLGSHLAVFFLGRRLSVDLSLFSEDIGEIRTRA